MVPQLENKIILPPRPGWSHQLLGRLTPRGFKLSQPEAALPALLHSVIFSI